MRQWQNASVGDDNIFRFGGLPSGLSRSENQFGLHRPGVFYARVTSVRLPHLRLFSIEESLPRIAFVSLPEEWLHFAFAVAPKRPSIWAGLEMQSLDLMVHSVGEHLHQQTSKGYKWSIMSVAQEFFASTSKALTGSTIVPPQVGRILRPSRADVGELQRHHQKVCRFAEAKPQALTSREVAEPLSMISSTHWSTA